MKKTIYSPLKAFHYAEQLRALETGTVAAPVHIRMKPTNACNHDCWFCAYRVENLELGADMKERDSIPHAKFLEIIEDIVTMGVKAVTFSGGGEPLIYKHLAEGIERMGRAGVKVAALTNGRFLEGAVADAFARYGTWVRVSMDYWDGASLHESRKVPADEFDKIVGNIRAFAARGSKCELGVSFIVTKENHRHIADFCRLIKDAGVNHMKLSGCVVSGDGRENNAYHAGIKDEVDRQILLVQELNDDRFKAIDHYHELDERFDKRYTTCPFLQFLTVIGADCKVYTCQDKAYTERGTLGSIKDRSFKEFWFSEENARRMREIDPSRDCQHHCVTHAKNLLLTEYLNLDPDHLEFV
jgi:MoaA/NifB/PqqE/SkfB family radical SAM enzyme